MGKEKTLKAHTCTTGDNCPICTTTSDWEGVLDAYLHGDLLIHPNAIKDLIKTELKKAREEERKRVLDIIDEFEKEYLCDREECPTCLVRKRYNNKLDTLKQRIGE